MQNLSAHLRRKDTMFRDGIPLIIPTLQTSNSVIILVFIKPDDYPKTL